MSKRKLGNNWEYEEIGSFEELVLMIHHETDLLEEMGWKKWIK